MLEGVGHQKFVLGVLALSHAFSDPLSSHMPNGFANIHFAFWGHYDAQGDTSY